MEQTAEKELHACCKSNATDTEACTGCTEEKTEEKCCGCHKTKHRSDEEYKKLIHRLNRIEGQIRGIRGMVEKSAYLKTCVEVDILAGNDDVFVVLVATLQKLMR